MKQLQVKDLYESCKEQMNNGNGDKYIVVADDVEGLSIDDWVKNYIDYDRMGDDMVSDGDYTELSDGRIVEYNY